MRLYLFLISLLLPMYSFCNSMFISVLSYNIYHDVKIEQTSSSYNIIEKWDKRKDQVLEVLQKSAADIICLQEDLPHQYKYGKSTFGTRICPTYYELHEIPGEGTYTKG